MSSHNSLINYVDLYLHLYRDVVGATASVRTIECRRDICTLVRRYEAEGMSFLTKTLPRLGKALDKALSTGAPLQFSSFAKRKGTQLPILYWWLFSEVFDSSGRERSDACPWALKRLRQLLLVYYKLELPYDETQNDDVVSKFIATDASLSFKEGELLGDDLCIAQRGKAIASRIASGICLRDIFPRHGPGSVSTGEKGSEKCAFKRIFLNLERMYPFTEYFFFNLTHLSDRLDALDTLEEMESGTAKVVLVPKDSRGPRLISCEPLENQWIQQGQMAAIVDHLESNYPTKGQVNFTSQEVNRKLALASSLDGSWATLDMKDASDRVSLELVSYLFPPYFVEQLCSSRSTHTKLPDGTVIPLKKFAPMGSAVCFPIEALVFWSLCVAIVMYTRDIPFATAAKGVYVYGDDLIVRSEYQAAIRRHLPSFDLLVNEDKCCTAGFFRESCGCDAYKGIDVTPLKIKKVWSHRREAGPYSSWVSYSNSLWEAGYYEAATYLEILVQKIRKTPYANRAAYSGICLLRDHVDVPKSNRAIGVKSRYNVDLQRREWLGWHIQALCESLPLRNEDGVPEPRTDWEEMLRVFASRRLKPTADEDWALNLFPDTSVRVEPGIYAIPRRNRLQRGWFGET